MKTAVCLFGIAACVSSVFAAPTFTTENGSTWTRGDTGSTYTEWTFDTNNSPSLTGQNNVYEGITGTTSLDVISDPSWALGMGYIPNISGVYPNTTVWMEINFNGAFDDLTLCRDNSTDNIPYFYSGTTVNNTTLIGWTISPSTQLINLNFTITGSINSITMDTYTPVAPAPAALALSSLGVAMVGYIRRRHH